MTPTDTPTPAPATPSILENSYPEDLTEQEYADRALQDGGIVDKAERERILAEHFSSREAETASKTKEELQALSAEVSATVEHSEENPREHLLNKVHRDLALWRFVRQHVASEGHDFSGADNDDHAELKDNAVWKLVKRTYREFIDRVPNEGPVDLQMEYIDAVSVTFADSLDRWIGQTQIADIQGDLEKAIGKQGTLQEWIDKDGDRKGRYDAWIAVREAKLQKMQEELEAEKPKAAASQEVYNGLAVKPDLTSRLESLSKAFTVAQAAKNPSEKRKQVNDVKKEIEKLNKEMEPYQKLTVLLADAEIPAEKREAAKAAVEKKEKQVEHAVTELEKIKKGEEDEKEDSDEQEEAGNGGEEMPLEKAYSWIMDMPDEALWGMAGMIKPFIKDIIKMVAEFTDGIGLNVRMRFVSNQFLNEHATELGLPKQKFPDDLKIPPKIGMWESLSLTEQQCRYAYRTDRELGTFGFSQEWIDALSSKKVGDVIHQNAATDMQIPDADKESFAALQEGLKEYGASSHKQDKLMDFVGRLQLHRLSTWKREHDREEAQTNAPTVTVAPPTTSADDTPPENPPNADDAPTPSAA